MLRGSFGSNAMVGEQTPEGGIFLLQTKALLAERIDFGIVSGIAVHQSMIHHHAIVLLGFATVRCSARAKASCSAQAIYNVRA